MPEASSCGIIGMVEQMKLNFLKALQEWVFLKNRVSMPDLVQTKTHRKQIFWSLGPFQAGPHQQVVQTEPVKTEIHP